MSKLLGWKCRNRVVQAPNQETARVLFMRYFEQTDGETFRHLKVQRFPDADEKAGE